uniref:Uncharacterized protein n=1 Tax=Arundo donax TaxID=35708 RepID=A0A0A9DWI5_ARUDO
MDLISVPSSSFLRVVRLMVILASRTLCFLTLASNSAASSSSINSNALLSTSLCMSEFWRVMMLSITAARLGYRRCNS